MGGRGVRVLNLRNAEPLGQEFLPISISLRFHAREMRCKETALFQRHRLPCALFVRSESERLDCP